MFIKSPLASVIHKLEILDQLEVELSKINSIPQLVINSSVIADLALIFGIRLTDAGINNGFYFTDLQDGVVKCPINLEALRKLVKYESYKMEEERMSRLSLEEIEKHIEGSPIKPGFIYQYKRTNSKYLVDHVTYPAGRLNCSHLIIVYHRIGNLSVKFSKFSDEFQSQFILVGFDSEITGLEKYQQLVEDESKISANTDYKWGLNCHNIGN